MSVKQLLIWLEYPLSHSESSERHSDIIIIIWWLPIQVNIVFFQINLLTVWA